MKKYFLLFSISCVCFLPAISQTGFCPVEGNTNNAAEAASRENYEAALQNWMQQNSSGITATTITIPVVVHVVWKTATQNITDQQVFSQIDVLNEDYGRNNADTINTPSGFQPVAANTGIQFCMAQVDPNGNPTNGIDRVQTGANSFSGNNDVKFSSSNGADAWDPSRYFNIWVCNLVGPLGTSEFPTSVLSQTFGVVIRYNVFGRVGTVSAPYDNGRCCTHEIGHCLNLLHPTISSSCIDADQVADTPVSSSQLNNSCQTYPLLDACNPTAPGVMYMNYMNAYSDDDCVNMFTAGQAARMNAVLNIAPYNSLDTSTACGPLGIIRHESGAELIYVSPNPSQGIFTLNMNGNNTAKITVYDIIGNVIAEYSTVTGTLQVDLSAESKGIYFLQVITKENVLINKKIILSN